jgi:thermolysin
MMGTSAEFFYRSAGTGTLVADYLIGADVIRGPSLNGIRSMANPSLFGDPDHYSRRFLGASDAGGVHTNAGISNNAFYLAIEGGTNRTSGLSVQGVGGENREQIERVFYRAFAFLLPSGATFSLARATTIQAARDLYGIGSGAERAVTQAWTAVGVN